MTEFLRTVHTHGFSVLRKTLTSPAMIWIGNGPQAHVVKVWSLAGDATLGGNGTFEEVRCCQEKWAVGHCSPAFEDYTLSLVLSLSFPYTPLPSHPGENISAGPLSPPLLCSVHFL